MSSKATRRRIHTISRRFSVYSLDVRKPLFAFMLALSSVLSSAHAQQSCPIIFDKGETRAVSRKLMMTLNHAIKNPNRSRIALDHKIEITGKLQEYILDSNNQIAYVSFSGPTRLSDILPDSRAKLIRGQDEAHHAPGFGTAVGAFKMKTEGKNTVLEFDNGVVVRGVLSGSYTHPTLNEVSIMSFTDCTVTRGDQVLFEPSWGTYDMAVGSKITSIEVTR